ncbi:hypothetical protein PFISCL1PPCAC_183, partial [Pristionchus fissidentatus]
KFMNSAPQSLLLFLLLLHSSTACSCARKDAKWVFYRSDFVSLVRVERVMPVTENDRTIEVIYHVKHLDVFKAPSGSRNLSTEIWTAGDQGTCGVSLVKGQELVLSSFASSSWLKIGLCTHGIIDRSDAEKMRQTN